MASDATLEERAALSRQGDTLKIVVTRKDGSVLGERVLSAAAPCDELETLASVVLATWISDVHPEFVAALPAAPSRADMPGDVSATAPKAATEPPPAEVAAPGTVEPISAPRVAAPAQRWRWELGVAGGAAFSDRGISGLGTFGVRWMPERLGFGAALGAHFVTPRTERLSGGSVRYWRWPVAVGPALRFPMGPSRVDLHAGLALGWLRAEGRGFVPSTTRNLLRGGGVLGLRGQLGAGSWRGFVDVSGVLWGKTEAFVDQEGGEQPSISLPIVELYTAVGVAWVP